MQRLRARLHQVARTPLPVLLVGETGTGKEVAARVLHEASGRPGPFVPVDCGALSPSLVEAELFGYERGAFTGANQRREGLVRAAHRGTFFLDEIGELTLEAQTRLLRLLESGTYRPLGAEQELSADLRIVAATWRDLKERVDEGRFRRDLYPWSSCACRPCASARRTSRSSSTTSSASPARRRDGPRRSSTPPSAATSVAGRGRATSGSSATSPSTSAR
jgi:transcriptional regulator with AAA-type ATPase domain